MSSLRLVVVIALLFINSNLLAQSEVPFVKGTKISVATTAGECSGTFQAVKSGFLEIQEAGRAKTTFIPMASVGFIRIDQTSGTEVRGDLGDSTNQTELNVPTRNASVDSARRAGGSSTASKTRARLNSEIVDLFDAGRVLQDNEARTDQHFIFGKPRITDMSRFRFTPDGSDDEIEGYSEYEKDAYTLGHYEKYRVPAWVAMKWTKEDLRNNQTFDRDDFEFDDDPQVPSFARGPTRLRHGVFGFERGHMARNRDLYAFGFNATKQGFFMSNIVPQQQPGHASWGHLENEHRGIVGARSDIEEIWVVSGPIFRNDEPLEVITNQGRTMAAPHATYKVIGWFTGDDFHCRGYIIDQEDRIDRRDLGLAIRAVDTIEDLTGIDFFHELPDAQENLLESKVHARLWDDRPVVPADGVTIAAIMPDPFGIDTDREFVRLANSSNNRVRLTGWKLRDESGNEFDLSRFFVNRRSSFQIQLRDTTFSLNNGGDIVELLDQGGNVVSTFQYDEDDVVTGMELTR